MDWSDERGSIKTDTRFGGVVETEHGRLICRAMRIYYAHNYEVKAMQTRPIPKKPTNLTLDQHLLSEARSFGVNLSQAAEAGLRRAVKDAKAAAWIHENAQALEASNAWVESYGLPLEKYRIF